MGQVESRLEGAVRRGRSDGVLGSGRRSLPARHGVSQVVDADHFQIDVAAGSVNQVIAADGGEVAVSGVNDDVQLRIRQLQSGGEGDGAAVRGVKRVELHVSGHAARTAN